MAGALSQGAREVPIREFGERRVAKRLQQSNG